MGFNKKSRRPPKNRKTKKILVFDEKARQEFLTGFRKRKNERRKKAQDEKKIQLKEEKKEMKQKRMQMMEKSRSYKGKHQNLEQDLKDFIRPEVLDLPQHTVTITDISEVDLAGQDGLRLGQNKLFEDEEIDDEDEATEETESTVPFDKKALKPHLTRKKSREQHMKKIRHKNYTHAQDKKFKMKHRPNFTERKKIRKKLK